MVPRIVADRKRMFKMMPLQIVDDREEFAPVPPAKSVLVPECGPRRVPFDKVEGGKTRREKRTGVCFGQDRNLILREQCGNDCGGKREIAETPKLN